MTSPLIPEGEKGGVQPPMTTADRGCSEPAALLKLAERCEREQPSRELDAAILKALGHQAIARKIALTGWEWRKNGTGTWSRMPQPTTSLDAAVTLVPTGCSWGADSLDADEGAAHVYLDGHIKQWDDCAKTPALALCAAALRARAALTKAES